MSKPSLVKTTIPHVMRDTSSGALINTNRAALDAIKARKMSMQRIEQVEFEIASLNAHIKCQTNKIDRISDLLEQIVNRNSGGN